MIDDALPHLGDGDLRDLAAALRSGRLPGPYTAIALGRFLAPEPSGVVAAAMERLRAVGLTPQHLALVFDILAADRARRPAPGEIIDLVATGPEAPGAAVRDTSVVVRELFAHARESVLVVGYAVYQGRQIFRALADRMTSCPGLRVTMFLDVHRPAGDTSADSEILARFLHRFTAHEWPGGRLPDLYYDPRSLDGDAVKRASLHAKCIVIDQEAAFVSSANFTGAAQIRNIEVGVLIRSPGFAVKLARHFETLAAEGILRRVPGSFS